MGRPEPFVKSYSQDFEELKIFFQKLSEGFSFDQSYLLSFLNKEEIDSNLAGLLVEVAKKLEEFKNFELSFQIYKRLSIISEDYLGRTIDLALICGDLFLAELAAEKYLKFLSKKKNFRLGFNLIDQLEKHGLGKNLISFYRILFSLVCGDTALFDRTFKTLGKDFSEQKNFHIIINYPDFTLKNEEKWKNLKNFKKLKLQKLLFKMEVLGEDNLILRKDFLTLLFDYKILYPDDNYALILLSRYAGYFNLKNIGDDLKNYLQENKKKVTKDDYYLALTNLEVRRPPEKSPAKVTPIRNEMDISFVGKKIIKELDKFDKEQYINEKCLLKVCELLEEKLVSKYYGDISVCFLMLGFYESANYILDRYEIESKDLKLEEKININYLKINICLKQKNFWRVVFLSEEVLQNYPLKPEEEICFNYLKAEGKFFLGQHNEAKRLYLGINKIFPNYRMVKERIVEIESRK